MRKHISKLAVVASVLMLTSAFAAYSVGVNVDARLRAKVNDGANALAGAQTIDDSEINATASIDNVSASVGFERNGDHDHSMNFNSFNVTVSDLFGGLLTLRFFEWGYGAGGSYDEGNYILQDNTYTGVYATIKPLDILSIGIGYGVAAGGGVPYSDGTRVAPPEDDDGNIIDPEFGGIGYNDDGGTHAIKLAIGITGTGFPVNIYFGTILNNAVTGKPYQRTDDAGALVYLDENGDDTTAPDNGDTVDTVAYDPALSDEGRSVEFGVNSMSIGADVKLYQDYLDLGVGVVLPIGTAVQEDKYDAKSEADFIAFVVLSGKASILDTGLTVNYALSYSTESENPDASKRKEDLGFDFSDMLRVKLGLDWSAGIITVGNTVGMQMGDIKKNTVDKKDYNRIDVSYEPSLTLAFASGFSVKFFYELAAEGVAGVPEGVDATLAHTLGMDVGAKFGVSSE